MKRRKNYYIKKRFQANFFVKFSLLMLLEAAAIAFLFMFISKGTLVTAYRGTELTIQKTGAFFFVSFLLISLVVGIAIGLIALVIFMYLSHRLGGPLYRFEQTVEKARRGDLAQRVQLRKTDQLYDIKERMNIFLEEMDNRISKIKKGAEKGLSLTGGNLSSDDTAKLKTILKDIVASLDFFKTSK